MAIWLALPLRTLGGGGMFLAPSGDLATNLIGHLAYQAPGWHWPLFNAPDLAWPAGQSMAMTDSNPLVSIIAKVLATISGAPMNWLGAWLAVCLVLQPLAAVYALRGMLPAGRNALAAACAASVLALLMPEWLFRIIHINLLGQFLLLAALGLAVRACRARRTLSVRALLALNIVAVLIHPYLFMFCVMICAGPCLQAALTGQGDGRAGLRALGMAALASAGLYLVLNGGMGTGGPGFGQYSMDALGPLWPQRSGLFGADLPILDSTGFQHEGFNYLGAGVLGLLAAAGTVAGRTGLRTVWRGYQGLILVLLAMTALAITPHVTAGGYGVLPVSCAWLERPFAVLRSSGRAFWAVGFALMLGAMATLAARLRPPAFTAVVAACLVLQWLDTGPLRGAALLALAGGSAEPAALKIPADTTLYRTVPVCDAGAVVADGYRLVALRQGAHLADARLAHDPPDAVCDAMRRAGLTAPLQQGETRLFLPSVADTVSQASFGDGVVCNRSGAGLLCHLPRSILGSTRPPPGR